MQTVLNLKPGEGRLSKPYNILGMPVYLKIGGADTNGEVSIFYSEYTKRQGPPLHLHDVDETFYVTEGEFAFQIGEERITASTGGTVFVPRKMPHAFMAISEVAKMLFIVNPTGNVEKIFERLDAFETMPSVEEVIRVHEELGLKIVGPPLNQFE